MLVIESDEVKFDFNALLTNVYPMQRAGAGGAEKLPINSLLHAADVLIAFPIIYAEMHIHTCTTKNSAM